MKVYALRRGNNYCAWQLAEDIEKLFRSGAIDRNTACKEHRAQRWRTVADIFPLLKYQRILPISLYRAHDVGCWQISENLQRSNPKLIISGVRTSSTLSCRSASLMKRLLINANTDAERIYDQASLH